VAFLEPPATLAAVSKWRGDTGPDLATRNGAPGVGRSTALPTTALLVLLLTSFPWVAGADEASSVESSLINAVKLALVLAAAATAVWAGPARPLPLGHLLIAGYGLVTAAGALVAAHDVGAAIRSGRLILLVVVVGLLAGHLTQEQLLRAIAGAAGAVAGTTLLASAAGLAAPVADGRLTGFLPPMHPNILASLCMVGLVSMVGLWLQHGLPHRWLLVAPVLVAVLVGTGSRTSLATAGVGIAVVLVAAALRGRQRATGLVLWLLAAGGLVLVGASSSSLRAFVLALLTRGGTATIDPTLTGRTYVWADAAAYHSTIMEKTIGQGLGIKALPRWVGNTFEVQGIDSTWYSAWVAGGAMGVVLVGGALVAWLWAAARRSATALALVVAIAAASPTESVLADISFGLVVLLAVTAAALPGSPSHAAPRAAPLGAIGPFARPGPGNGRASWDRRRDGARPRWTAGRGPRGTRKFRRPQHAAEG
jgi:O-antigen ligase